MGTLYDLLGALPSDDAEGLRTAFRKAAKATHPDINPDNPDAALRFRELVRAYDILTDTEQRATYEAENRRGGAISGGGCPQLSRRR